jgi:hypothetical protein
LPIKYKGKEKEREHKKIADTVSVSREIEILLE